ncbi:hypothetical protein [Lacinutrix sp. MedPE-SW]|uniref:hypothetical protein n=1 Tax=Lacinutrix sp. MedPE-SW TaxID=1860087 RepID=UPI00091924A3|nr:hypothetical protein [Lacinutrix sp. MedPE-SW]OIQ21932.1 MAG: hypothetical protein BM549_08330 [Lacinutrix sp. MedPE-SW]
MRIIKQLFDFYLNSSIHVALAVCALSCITLFEFNIIYDETIIYFNFFATITGYNFVKYFGIAKFHHRSLTNALKVIQVFSFLCFVLLCFYATKLPLKTLFYILIFGVITFLYAIPFIPKNLYIDSQQNLRDISGVKVYIIAMVWVGVTVFIPLLNNAVSLTADVYIVAIQRFLFVVVLMLPFEIRDLKFDSLKLATIPQKIGVRRTKLLGLVLLVLFFFLNYFKDFISVKSIVTYAFVTLITLLFLTLSHKKRSYYFSSFWVESIPILWLLIILFC